jgi:hypothetical protein
MALNSEDMEALYKAVFQRGNYSPSVVPIEAIAYIEMIKNNKYDAGMIKHMMKKDLENLKEECNGVWKSVWSEKSLPIREALYEVLFCPLEEVPLHINGQYLDIAKWRLENAK